MIKRLKEVYDILFREIHDTEIIDILKSDSFIAGGCFCSLINGEEPKDFDIFFTNKESSEKIKSFILNYCPEIVNHVSDRAMSLIEDVQLITSFTGEKRALLESFDFEHLQAAYSYDSKNIYYYDQELSFTITCQSKNLFYTGSDYPLSSYLRMYKFLGRGFTTSYYEATKILFSAVEKLSSIKNENGTYPIEKVVELFSGIYEDYQHSLSGDVTLDDLLGDLQND